MSILEPVVDLVGRLSFRNKMRATAAMFGVPLLVALSLILAELGARVSVLQHERTALAVQVPALDLLARLHQLLAVSHAVQEGAEQLDPLVAGKRDAAQAALRELQSAFAGRALLPRGAAKDERWLGRWDAISRQIAAADIDKLAEMTTSIRGELDKLNEETGLLIDGEASSSRLLDIMTTHLPGMIETTGRAAQIGGVVLVKKSIRGSRRTELTLQRGNFDALVLWSMEGLQKVAREHPQQAAALDDAGSRLNTAYLGIQEVMTTKMLDTADFDMAPEAFLALTAKAFAETLEVGAILVREADLLLAERMGMLELQRNSLVAVMALILALIVAGFVAAYISIIRSVRGLADAVDTMASGDLGARAEISTRDELGKLGVQFNTMVENLAQRTAQLREKTNDIHNMLQNMPQGILTIVDAGVIHPEYSAYLETIFAERDVAGRDAMEFLFAHGSLGADALSQVAATISACLGEDRMNYDLNAHLLAREVEKTMPDGQAKFLELLWSPICDDHERVEKIMLCVRDVTELRKLEAEAEQQKRELALIGQILQVNQEKFHEFVASARNFVAENEQLLRAADDRHPELVTQLFRNMHTIKGNARTYGLLHLTNVVHEAEQAYDELRRNSAMAFEKEALLGQLQGVMRSIEEYASLNEVKLGRKGPGRRGSAEKYVMVQRDQVRQMLANLEAIDLHAARPETLAALLQQVRLDLRLIGTERIQNILDGVFASLPSLARELGKEPPRLQVHDHGLCLRNQVADLLRNVFMHLYRNSMDHGIETAAERSARGKPPAGTIRLDLSLVDGRLALCLSDDGKGLALGYIRRKGIEQGLIAADAPCTDEEIAQLIFAAGFSTAAAVTEVSGRGVGMDAVQGFIRREGGEIRLRFTDDRAGADHRAFETMVLLPGRFAVETPDPATPHAPAGHQHKAESGTAATRIRSLVAELLLPGKLETT